MADALARFHEFTLTGTYPCILSMPPGYAGDATRSWPLILFLHGLGERGTDVWEVARQGLPRVLQNPPNLSAEEREVGREVAAQFIVLAPQCPPDEVWDSAALLTLLDATSREFRIDLARVYATGLSMGGFGTWTLGTRHPGRLAAIAPVCGGGRLADISATLATAPADLRSLGVWAFHGAKDRVVPPDESERMVAALRSAGVADVRLTVYPDVQHDAWTAAYADPKLYSWLLSHTR